MRYFFLLIVCFAFIRCLNTCNTNHNIYEQKINIYLNIAKDSSYSSYDKNYYNKKAYEIIIKHIDDSIQRLNLLEVAKNYFYNNEKKLFYKISNQLNRSALRNNDSLMLGRSHQYIAIYYKELFIYDSAFFHYNKAKNIFIKLKNKADLPRIYLDIASIQFDINDYINCEKSLFFVLKNQKIENADDQDDKYVAYNLLGNIYCELNDLDKALEYQNKALKLVNEIKKNKKIYYPKETVLNNIGNTYRIKGEYRKAIKYFNIALRNSNLKKNFPSLYATLNDNLGYCNLKLKKFDQSFKFFSIAYTIRDSLNIKKALIVTDIHLSEYYSQKNNINKALFFSNRAMILSKNKNFSNELLISLIQLINVDNKNIKNYSLEYIRISDSLQLAERKIRNKFTRIAYETDEITTQKDDAVKQKWLVLGIAIFIFLLGILLFIIKMQRSKQKELLLSRDQQKANESIYQLIHDQQLKIDQGRQIEKKRIAQELHDGVMNKLTSTRLNLFILSKRKDEETINKCLGFIDNIQDIEKEIRQVAHDLSNDIFLGTKSFNNILQTLFDEQRSISIANIHTEIDQLINWEIIESELKMNLYRTLQEALQNCNKYAEAKNIFVTITNVDDALHVVVNDDGVGFDLNKEKLGIGLRNMKERIKKLSGKIDILSQKGKGTTIIVNLPIKNKQQFPNNGKKN